MVKSGTKSSSVRPGRRKEWDFRLYVADHSPVSLRAFENLRKICEEYMAGNCNIEVIDVTRTPRVAAMDQILALPALVLKVPGQPSRKMMIGDLSNTERVLARLEFVHGSAPKPRSSPS